MSFLISVFKPLAYISLPIVLIRSISASSPVARYYTRVATYVGALLTVASCSIFVAAGMSLVGRSNDVNNIVARIFYGLVHRVLDVKIEVEGAENLKTCPAILMCNHQSMLDILIIGRLMPKQTAIMAKKSLQYTPLGPFMTMSGTIFIDRGNSAQAIRSIEAAGERLKTTKTSLWMFPEGTRHLSQKPDMLQLKKGGFHLALNAGIPITPIVVENYWRIYRKGIFDTGTIKVRVLPPISTTGLSAADVGTLATRVRDQMLETLRDISEKVPSGKRSSHPESQSAAPRDSSTPLDNAASLLGSSSGVIPDSAEAVLETKGSSSSLASSSFSSEPSHNRRKMSSSTTENGAETEEDEGMILVGRPSS
ncbi:hypothetical protein B0H34DRAFT_647462 [Crassisporium funariophilum]|nr:hypothetical protein B0H34DRAFT_647462 [Crassisporium funariophilum]